MAQATTARFGKFSIKLGNGATPPVYASPCGFTSKSLTLSKDLTEVIIPDCNDPDAVAWVGRDATSLSADVDGEGVMAAESAETWLDAFEDVESTPIMIEIEFPAKTIAWTGRMHISSLNPSAEKGGRVTMSTKMQSDGELIRTVTDNA